MNCQTIRELLVDYAGGETTESVRLAVESHLAGCASCQHELDALQALLDKTRGAAVPDPGQAFWNAFPQQVLESCRAEAESRPSGVGAKLLAALRSWWPMPGNPSFAYAMVVVVIIGTGVTLALLRQDQEAMDSYQFQAHFSDGKSLAAIAAGNAFTPPSPNIYGFVEATTPNFFAVGAIYSQTLASVLGGDTASAYIRLSYLSTLLDSQNSAALTREIQHITDLLSNPKEHDLAIQQLASLQKTLAAAAKGERERVLFDAGRIVMDIRLAALAHDPQLAAGAAITEHLPDELRKVGLAPGAAEAASQLHALLKKDALSADDHHKLQYLLDQIQTVLM